MKLKLQGKKLTISNICFSFFVNKKKKNFYISKKNFSPDKELFDKRKIIYDYEKSLSISFVKSAYFFLNKFWTFIEKFIYNTTSSYTKYSLLYFLNHRCLRKILKFSELELIDLFIYLFLRLKFYFIERHKFQFFQRKSNYWVVKKKNSYLYLIINFSSQKFLDFPIYLYQISFRVKPVGLKFCFFNNNTILLYNIHPNILINPPISEKIKCSYR